MAGEESQDVPTRGWRFNQVGIRVSDLQKSLSFYQDVLGLKELVRMDLDTVKIWMLGYPDNARPGASMLDREGVLELVYSQV